MSKKEKLLAKLLASPADFTFTELEALLGYFSYHKAASGKTAGSRITFVNQSTGSKITLHKPHPRKELLAYQIKQIIETLQKEGLL